MCACWGGGGGCDQGLNLRGKQRERASEGDTEKAWSEMEGETRRKWKSKKRVSGRRW